MMYASCMSEAIVNFMRELERNRNIEGYWNNADNYYPQYPMPVHSDVPFPDKAAILQRLTEIEGKLYKQRYMGFSVCRCCGANLGSGEYTLGDIDKPHWVWPEGFKHYIEVHNVRPSDRFLKELF